MHSQVIAGDVEAAHHEEKYLHISGYSCVKCEGRVIAASFGTRETEITRETDLTQGRSGLPVVSKRTSTAADCALRGYRQEFGTAVHR